MPLTLGVLSILSCGAVVSTTFSVPVIVAVELSLNLMVIETFLPRVSTLSIAGAAPSAKAYGFCASELPNSCLVSALTKSEAAGG